MNKKTKSTQSSLSSFPRKKEIGLAVAALICGFPSGVIAAEYSTAVSVDTRFLSHQTVTTFDVSVVDDDNLDSTSVATAGASGANGGSGGGAPGLNGLSGSSAASVDRSSVTKTYSILTDETDQSSGIVSVNTVTNNLSNSSGVIFSARVKPSLGGDSQTLHSLTIDGLTTALGGTGGTGGSGGAGGGLSGATGGSGGNGGNGGAAYGANLVVSADLTRNYETAATASANNFTNPLGLTISSNSSSLAGIGIQAINDANLLMNVDSTATTTAEGGVGGNGGSGGAGGFAGGGSGANGGAGGAGGQGGSATAGSADAVAHGTLTVTMDSIASHNQIVNRGSVTVNSESVALGIQALALSDSKVSASAAAISNAELGLDGLVNGSPGNSSGANAGGSGGLAGDGGNATAAQASDVTATASASLEMNLSASVVANTVNNSGALGSQTRFAASGIHLNADAQAIGRVRSLESRSTDNGEFGEDIQGSNLVSASAIAEVSRNNVANSGLIFSNQSGISLNANAYSLIRTETYSVLTGDYQSASGNTYADALINDNTIDNSGTIVTSGPSATGINLSAFAQASADSATGEDFDTVNGNTQAHARVTNNTIINTGGIFVTGSAVGSPSSAEAIRLSAIARNRTNIGDLDSTQIVGAEISNNVVRSSGPIIVDIDSATGSGYAINIQADALSNARSLNTIPFGDEFDYESWSGANTSALVLSNEIELSNTVTLSSLNNEVEGSVGKGIYLVALSNSNGNLELISTITDDSNLIELSGAAVSGNSVDTSATMSISAFRASAIELDAQATISTLASEGLFEFIALSSADDNRITNSGTIALFGEDLVGVRLNSQAVASVNGSIDNFGAALSSVSRNQITNEGSLVLTDSVPGYSPSSPAYAGDGIVLSATANVTRSVESGSLGEDWAQANVNLNEIRNTGTILALNDGIRLLAAANANYGSQSSATGTVNDNLIINRGTLTAGNNGIFLTGSSNADGVEGTSFVEVNDNIIENRGILQAGEVGIYIRANASSSGNSSAEMNRNTILNTGSINAENDEGIYLYALSISQNGEASSEVNDNQIDNSGTLNSSNESIHLLSVAQSQDAARATVNGSRITNSGNLTSQTEGGIYLKADAWSSNATSFAEIYDTVITNRGTLTSRDEGIRLDADAGAWTDNGEGYAYGYGNSDAMIHKFTFTNFGTLNASEEGINLRAIAYSEYGNAYAEIGDGSEEVTAGNSIYNYGTINAKYEGIDLYARAESNNSEGDATARIFNNTIINTGTIQADQEAIYVHVYASSNNQAFANITNNLIENHGKFLSKWSGIWMDAYASADNAANATIADNTILNTGSIAVTGPLGDEDAPEQGSVGILLTSEINQWYPDGSSIARIHNNTILNYGSIVAVDDGIRLNATSTNGYSYGEDSRITNNVLRNYGSVYSGDDAIDLQAEKIRDNEITNHGFLVSQDNGIDIGGSAEEILRNTITISSSGRIISGGHAISLEATRLDGNAISISGLVVTDRSRRDSDDDSGDLGRGFTVSGSSYTKSNEALWNQNRVDDLRRAVSVVGIADAGEDNTLSIHNPAYLAGEIFLERSADVRVDLVSGAGNSVRWSIRSDDSEDSGSAGQVNQEFSYTWKGRTSLTKANLSGTVPWFIQENVNDSRTNQRYDVYATIDPTAFAAAANQAGDLSGSISTMMNQGMVANKDRQHAIWLAAIGSRLDYDGNRIDTQDYKTSLGSYALGYSYKYNSEWLFGGLLGVTDSTMKVGSRYADVFSNSYDNKANGGFLSLNAATKLYGFDLNLGLSGGKQNHEDKRFVNDNLNWWGTSYATAKYSSQWLAPEFTLAYPWQVQTGLVLKPNVNVRYTTQRIGGYTESGSESNATVESRKLGIVDTTVGIDLTKTFGKSSLTARVAHLQRSYNGNDIVRVGMIGDSRDITVSTENMSAMRAGLLWKLNLASDLDLYVNGNYIHGSTVKGADGNVSLRLQF